jgi:uncharacterized protein|tara:strand:- start:55 stop:480 length:426 start_codon:yes stop_codon:yes gene_type:complete
MSEEKNEYQKPLPDFRPETKPFWDGTKNHKLLLPKCKDTGKVFFYPRAISPFPGSVNMDFDWVESSGKGKVWTFSVHYMGPTRAYKGETYVVAMIELDDGVKMMSNVVGIDPEEVKIGMEVEVVFEDATDEVTFAKFKPVQ